jgi:hypothetical protein
MATTIVKKKKFSLTTLLTIVLAVLPQILEAINDGAQTSHIVLDNSGSDGKLKAHVISVSQDGSINAMPSQAVLMGK